MPIAYYGSKISSHITRTPEGYLICHEVPINRIGYQDYIGAEIGADGLDAQGTYKVLRRPEEVFSAPALASFEGKPVTDNHPPESVTPNNIHAFARGHAQNVHRGTGENDGCTVADLYITDPQLIEDVMNGKREISCGYTYDLFPHKNGTYEQRSIRGNHIAVVDEGRAGHRVAIKDSKPTLTERGNKMVTENKKGFRGWLMKAVANDASPEDLERISQMKEPDEIKEEKGKDEAAENLGESPIEANKKAKDEAPEAEMLGKILEMLSDLKAMLAPKESEDELEDLINPEHESEETPEEEAEERITGHEDEDGESPEEQEPYVTVSPEEIKGKNSEKAMDSAARQIAIGVRQVLKNSIKDPTAYKVAAKDAAAKIRQAYGISSSNAGYSSFMKNSANAANARVAKDAQNVADKRAKAMQEQQNSYNAMNPHMNKEAK